jgi:acyl carrier protein
MKSMSTMVRALLAHHLDRSADTIRDGHHLARDLDLTPLELVLVALDIEEAEGVQIAVEELAAVETVGDLTRYLTGQVAAARRAVRYVA